MPCLGSEVADLADMKTSGLSPSVLVHKARRLRQGVRVHQVALSLLAHLQQFFGQMSLEN